MRAMLNPLATQCLGAEEVTRLLQAQLALSLPNSASGWASSTFATAQHLVRRAGCSTGCAAQETRISKATVYKHPESVRGKGAGAPDQHRFDARLF